MDLTLDPALAEGYSSKSQRSRVITEGWAADNLFCPACGQDPLEAHSAGRAVEDFLCPACDRRTQLKAKRGGHGLKVANSAYEKKMNAIEENNAPDYAFMGFDPERWIVTDLFIVPGHFLTPSVVEARAPLKASSRRAGWVGSNILLSRIPPQGSIQVVQDEEPLAKAAVLEEFQQTNFLASRRSDARGWLADTLECIDELGIRAGDTFELADIYRFEGRLQMRYPENNHIRAKLRQQLQILRDEGVLEFAGSGTYKVLPACAEEDEQI